MSVRTPLPLIDYTVTYEPCRGEDTFFPGRTSHAFVVCLRCDRMTFGGNGPGMHAALDQAMRTHMEAEHGPTARRRAR